MRLLAIALAAASFVPTLSSAAPLLSITPATIELSPQQTVVTLEVDPGDTPLVGLVLSLVGPLPGIWVLDLESADPTIRASGPFVANLSLIGGTFLGSFPERTARFTVGTVVVEGRLVGTSLTLTGTLTDSSLQEIPVLPVEVAVVVPEPRIGSLTAIGLALLALARRGGAHRANLRGAGVSPRARSSTTPGHP